MRPSWAFILLPEKTKSMRISRIFISHALKEGSLLEVHGETSHYIKSVLRLRKGWALILFNGEGYECPSKIESFGRDSTWLRLGTPEEVHRESPLHVHLVLGISRGERMDFAIQKAVELGVDHITPILTEHCVVRLEETSKADARHLHWARILRSSLEQCGRNKYPILDPPTTLDAWLGSRPPVDLEIMLDPQGERQLRHISGNPKSVRLLVGPEGGFSDNERQHTRSLGFMPIRFGPRILRTETAVIAGITSAQTLWGDLG